MDATARALLEKPSFREGLLALAEELDLSAATVRRQGAQALREMWTEQNERALAFRAWRSLGDFLLQHYDLVTDDARLGELRALERDHPLVFLFSHRSYLDGWMVTEGVRRASGASMFTLAGANLNFFPVGPLLRRTGGLFIRRSMRGADVYRYVLREYLGHLMELRYNLGWSIEGGRTRTGKLRPPRYGALRYVVDATRSGEGPEPYVVPVSVVYDQLGEVATMTAEALGADKRPEGLQWLLRYVWMQHRQGGTARVDFGEPIPLRQQMAALEADPASRDTAVERVALMVCHGINRVTPAMPTAVVTLAFLAAERGLTVQEVERGLEPILRYLAAHPHLPDAFRSQADRRDWIAEAVDQLLTSGVLERFDDGIEPVYAIADDQHLVAAFYRNTLIHFLVVRAIGELSMFLARDVPGDAREAIWQSALGLRDLLKFEFFFASRREFQRELLAEIETMDPEWDTRPGSDGRYTREIPRERWRAWFERARPHLAHTVLRPFLDAYRVVASALASWPPEVPVDEEQLLERSLRMGRQWIHQRRIHSAESVSLELFKNALQLAAHRELIDGAGPALQARREALAAELDHLVTELDELARQQGRP